MAPFLRTEFAGFLSEPDVLGFPGPSPELVFGAYDVLGFPGPSPELVFGAYGPWWSVELPA